MSKADPRVDEYIARQADFARPILDYLREVVRSACPDCEETLKWGMPSFLYRGRILACMAAFKRHASFNFWRGEEVLGDRAVSATGMGQFGQLRSIGDLPPRDALEALVRKAMALDEQGERPRRPPREKPSPEMPDDFRAALHKMPAAARNFAAFPPSAQRDYVDWVVDAKRPENRARRIGEAVGWIAEGKKRHWKYEKC